MPFDLEASFRAAGGHHQTGATDSIDSGAAMKNVLVLIHDDAGQEARFQAALDLTRTLSGHLTCLDVAWMPQFISDFDGSSGAAIVLADERVRETGNRGTLEQRLQIESVSWDWIDTVGGFSACLKRAADLTDLIVVNRKLDDSWAPDMRGVAGDILVATNKPIVAVPGEARSFDTSGKVLIAWNGSPAAAAALRAATPLLLHAGEVEIVEIVDSATSTTAQDAATYLSRHGIHPMIRQVAHDKHSLAVTLLDICRGGDYAYVVMGGFDHRRFSEAIFGGVTRKMLTESPIPMFLAH